MICQVYSTLRPWDQARAYSYDSLVCHQTSAMESKGAFMCLWLTLLGRKRKNDQKQMTIEQPRATVGCMAGDCLQQYKVRVPLLAVIPRTCINSTRYSKNTVQVSYV